MKELKVDAIKEGTVIDHIPAGKAFRIISILNLDERDQITIGTQLVSRKYGKKDIIKIEHREFSQNELNIITLIAPTATFVTIREYESVEKRKAEIPSEVQGLITCPNPACICNQEPMITRFFTVTTSPISLRCGYCERVYPIDDINKFINAG
jgi:aspartate carbamoyltransferase regulatory subunit